MIIYNLLILLYMPNPKDMKLYNSVKSRVYKRIPKHSAYRSGIVVSSYKRHLVKNMVKIRIHIVVKKHLSVV